MSRAKHLMKRFGTISEQLNESGPQGTSLASALFKARIEEQDKADKGVGDVTNEEDDESEGFPQERVLGAGVAEGHAKEPAYALHGPEYVQFAAMGQGGTPFVATMPHIDISDGIAWVNKRIKGFSANPKARESYEAAILRKGIAAMGNDFVEACKAKGGKSVKMELDMMMSPDSHSQIGDMDKIAKMPGVVHIDIETVGNMRGNAFGMMDDNDGNVYMTQGMLGSGNHME